MTTSEYLLNVGLLAYILYANLGTKVLSRRRLMLPILIVAAAGFAFLHGMPTAGNDTQLELAGLSAGAAFGVLAALLVRVRRNDTGQVVTTAGAAFAALWILVIGGRVLFAYGADHWFPRAIGQFSRTHQITGSSAWAASFVLMALAMVVTRVVVTAAQATRLGHGHAALAG